MLMENHPFEHVNLQLGNGARVVSIRSIHEALVFLSNEWPADKGRKYHIAIRACAEALESKRSGDEARRAFIDAAKAIDIYVHERTPSREHH
ncbi:DUF982 domain-containing protein [Phyllobacterium myrsinacearum]|uniref:DUF982 domain-containing protein n=1 Tax=Phyllobacterium myrsinacearum TaxID=28101 RepID=A0A839EHR6_9HYPH|nr:DUF982 domain-containing protein [Phyllobacterium myrsinacearum]MBA8876330.1 hypothetical protein [Phyllobacterium myrsinacearum]